MKQLIQAVGKMENSVIYRDIDERHFCFSGAIFPALGKNAIKIVFNRGSK